MLLKKIANMTKHLATIIMITAVWLPALNAQLIVEGEYFWNTDPGVGSATSFAVDVASDTVEQSFDIPLTGLNSGRNLLYTRMKNDDGHFGIAKVREVNITDVLYSAEYFWDVDPGPGNATAFNMISYGDSAMACSHVSTASLAAGIHYLYVRMRAVDGSWAIATRTDFIITTSSVATGCNGDWDKNGNVNTSDLLIFLGGFGSDENCELDLTGDFAINTSDLLLFLGVFGGECD